MIAAAAVAGWLGRLLARYGPDVPLAPPDERVPSPLENIRQDWTEQRRPSEVGGWGYRGPPGQATIMIRSGECLVIGYQSGGQLRISIDDAQHGAALLNALIQPMA